MEPFTLISANKYRRASLSSLGPTEVHKEPQITEAAAKQERNQQVNRPRRDRKLLLENKGQDLVIDIIGRSQLFGCRNRSGLQGLVDRPVLPSERSASSEFQWFICRHQYHPIALFLRLRLPQQTNNPSIHVVISLTPTHPPSSPPILRIRGLHLFTFFRLIAII